MADKSRQRRQVIDPAVADILSGDRRVNKEARSSMPAPATKTTAKTTPPPARSAQQTSQPPAEKPDTRDKPMTYRLGEAIIERINEAADRFNVEKSSLVKFLLTDALDRLETGQLMLPLDEKPRKLEV